jgi:hypothetical protein
MYKPYESTRWLFNFTQKAGNNGVRGDAGQGLHPMGDFQCSRVEDPDGAHGDALHLGVCQKIS